MRYRKGFTLIELLVVVAIIALLIALMLPSLAKAKEEAKLTKCMANLHAIGIAFATYNTQNNDLMPHGKAAFRLPDQTVDLGYAEALTIEDCFRQKTTKDGNPQPSSNYSYFAQGVGTFLCPSADTYKQQLFPNMWDIRIRWGYGMNATAASCFAFNEKVVTDFSVPRATPSGPPYPGVNANAWWPFYGVKAGQLNTNHILAVDGNPEMSFFDSATPSIGDGRIVFERHKRSASVGANYLMAGGHVEWSPEYGPNPMPKKFITPINWNNDFGYKGKLPIWGHGSNDSY